MEFFEKAHVFKNKPSSKHMKGKETIKKQLKQMLHGYKTCDNEVIKKSTDFKTDFEDSSSVSGFSDLNLSNSFSKNTANITFDSSQENSMLSIEDNIRSPCSSNTSNNFLVENSKYDNNVGTVSPEVSFEMECKRMNSSLCSSDLSVDSSDSYSEINSLSDNISDEFDATGELAAKIHNKLQGLNIETTRNSNSKPTEKRKKSQEIILNKTELSNKPNIDDTTSEHSSEKSIEYSLTLNATSNSNDIPFVSITAEDMPHQTFDEIVGEYKYSTTRNLSAENHNNFTSENIFIDEESMNVDIHTEEDIGSMIPELGEEPSVDDLEISLIQNLDTPSGLDESILQDEELVLDEPSLTVETSSDELSNKFQFYYGEDSCVVVLKHPTELFIQGKVKIKALGGKVVVFGYTLDDRMCELYAPYYNIAQSIKTFENDNVYYGLFGKLTAVGLTVLNAEEIVTTLGTYDAIIYLEKYKSKKIDFIEDNFTLANLFSRNNWKKNIDFKKASNILDCSLYLHRPHSFLNENLSWNEAYLSTLYGLSKGVVCGGKGVGKSTFLRYQVNKLLEKGPVLVLDLDPGQSEFTVAGNISATVVTDPLLGPSFTHLKKPDIMLNIGMINTMENVTRYVHSVHRLISESYREFVNIPWLVNTMGLTSSLGLKLITLIILYVKPTYLLQYDSKAPKKRFETYLDVENVKKLYATFKYNTLFRNVSTPYNLEYSFIVAQDSDKLGRSSMSLAPRDERLLNFLAYFSDLTNTARTENILAVTPYEVHLKDINLFTNIKIKEDLITKVINGKVVALCQYPSQCDSAKVFTLSDKPLLCHGHGLIRGIDCEKELLYIVTPLSSVELSKVNTLLYADWAPDLGTFESHVQKDVKIPYTTKANVQQKHLMVSPRRRFNPLQLLKMTRNS